ncbi:hypothetical protein Daus18300_006237 [Diaporthe australafricana]|uniref:Uncharacterized protein n=1 Tax=Diaporthe australafricana TaxID=127596 RepID=A0ABR3WVI9_9PEZI
MDISLEEVKLAQVFHHADGRSVKGICFDYKDGEKASIGCCEAEPGAWSGFVKPECFLFKIRPGHYVGEAFFPVEDISFAAMDDQPGTFTHCIHMEDSVAFHLSPDGLEIDIRYEKMRKAPYRCKRTSERVKDALKGWVARNPIVARLRKKLCPRIAH